MSALLLRRGFTSVNREGEHQSMDSDRKAKIIIIVGVAILLLLFGTSWINGKTLRYELVTQHGELPFRYEYEKDGERYVIEDILVIDYKGRGFDMQQYLKSEGSDATWEDYEVSPELILYKSDGLVHSYDRNVEEVFQEIRLLLNPHDFMEGIDYDGKLTIQLREVEEFEPIEKATHPLLSEQQLYEDFGIKTISWTPPKPIENEYVKKCLLCF
jgi:hypothetical protein